MNSRPSHDDRELPSGRVSARSRFAPPPSAAFASPSSYVATSSKSKGGINGRAYDDDDDDDEDELQLGLSSRSHLRKEAKRSNSSGGSLNSSQRSLRSTDTSNSNKDRPWRTNSTSSSTAASTYATANDYETSVEFSRHRSNDSAGSAGSNKSMSCSSIQEVEVTTPTRNRWAQYETDDLAEESRKATSNAVVDMATKIANDMAETESPERESRSDEQPMIERQLDMPMGGDVGSGYDYEDPWAASTTANVGTGYGHEDHTEGLEVLANRRSLPVEPPTINNLSSSSRSDVGKSTTDYVKSRLSSLVTQRSKNNDYDLGLSRGSPTKQSDHDKVRNEAMKMLEIADSCLSDSPLNNGSSPSSPRSSRSSSFSDRTTGLFRTSTGGIAMREMHHDEVSQISVKREKASSIAGINNFRSEKSQKFDGTFTIGSQDEDDLRRHNSSNSNGEPISPNEDTPSRWSSRYSVERQLMAITGGLDSTHMLAKMDMLHSSREKTKSARGLYRASGYAMDGSHEEYNDYTTSSSSGLGLGGAWMWLKGTLWSDDLELNYDGTTQSLVRREKAMQKRRRLRWGLAFLLGLSVAVGVLTHLGTPKSKAAYVNKEGDVKFYVLADEPYDFSNVELLTRELEALPADAEFVIHLGNANGDEQSRCQEYGFERAAAILKESPVPVLVIPGDLDWAACGSQKASEKALEYWDINLGRKLANHWDHSLDIDYMDDVVGNFAFLHKGVLFISVNIVDAETDPGEVTSRLEQNVMWTKRKLSNNQEEYHAVVILGHAPPSSKQVEYFLPIIEQIKDLQKPVLYLHANSNGSFEQYTPFNEAENFKAVQLEQRGKEAPMRVVVLGNSEEGKEEEDGDGMDMFLFERREPTLERTEK